MRLKSIKTGCVNQQKTNNDTGREAEHQSADIYNRSDFVAKEIANGNSEVAF